MIERKKSKYTSVLQEQHFSGGQRPITMIRYSGKSEREEAPSFPPCLVDFSRLCSRGGFPFISRRSFDYFIIIYSTLTSGTAPRVCFDENVSGSAVVVSVPHVVVYLKVKKTQREREEGRGGGD